MVCFDAGRTQFVRIPFSKPISLKFWIPFIWMEQRPHSWDIQSFYRNADMLRVVWPVWSLIRAMVWRTLYQSSKDSPCQTVSCASTLPVAMSRVIYGHLFAKKVSISAQPPSSRSCARSKKRFASSPRTRKRKKVAIRTRLPTHCPMAIRWMYVFHTFDRWCDEGDSQPTLTTVALFISFTDWCC